VETSERYPALRGITSGRVDAHDRVRRELWRAYQAGKLSEDELASTLDRLDWWQGRVEQRRRNDRCEHCHLLGIHALQAEQTVADLPSVMIWRHTKCQHVLMWRGGSAAVVRSELRQRLYALIST